MGNPFATRATEYVSTTEGFLSIVSPDPVLHFFEPFAQEDRLYRQLIVIHGTPGSGKTTIAKLFEFSALATLARASENENYAELISTLNRCQALVAGEIRLATCRLPLESDYQEIWQLPYSEKIRTDLLFRLIQARAVIAWFGQFQRAGIEPQQVQVEPREGYEDLVRFIGGAGGESVLGRAKEVERAIYTILGALIPPREEQIESQFQTPFRIFDCLARFRLQPIVAARVSAQQTLTPLVILDDAHYLHQAQLQALKSWLIRRELKLARWIMSRLDVLQPNELFTSVSKAGDQTALDVPGSTKDRDYILINLQSTNRSDMRREFRSLAKKMAGKYLRQMDVFRQNEITELADILQTKIDVLADGQVRKLREEVQALAKRLKIGSERLNEYRALVDNYCDNDVSVTEDVRIVMLRIVLNRYGKRVPQQELMFMDEGPAPSRPIKVDIGIYDAACIHLTHDYERPFYVGIDALCDIASENAEMFLRMCAHLVEVAESKLLKQQRHSITPKEQHRLLRERAANIIKSWDFPEVNRVRKIASFIARRCWERTHEPNAPLGAGANAFGVPSQDFERVAVDYPELAQVLKFGVAYNALCLVPNSTCKNRVWCLFELGGPLIVCNCLPWKRGGFVEGSLEELARVLQQE